MLFFFSCEKKNIKKNKNKQTNKQKPHLKNEKKIKIKHMTNYN